MPNPFATEKLKKMTRHEPISVQHEETVKRVEVTKRQSPIPRESRKIRHKGNPMKIRQGKRGSIDTLTKRNLMVLPFHRFAMLHKKQAVAQHQFQRTVRHNITVAPLNHNNQRSFRERQFANMTSPLQKLFRTKHFA